jgi:hypothetical protein
MKEAYLIQSLEDSYYKIGVSKHPKKRLKQLRTGNSSELKLVESYPSDLHIKSKKRYSVDILIFKKRGSGLIWALPMKYRFLKNARKSRKH